MDQQINERWLQFGYINAKGNLTKTALKIPFHMELAVDQEFPVIIMGKQYNFDCKSVEYKSNDNNTVDITYVVATNYQ